MDFQNNEFIECYHKVFDRHGNIMACGRENCINLMELAEELKPNITYGNKNTGTLDITNIKELYKELIAI